MAETLTLATNRPPRPASTGPGSIELVGRSAIVARVLELVRRSAPLDTGLLIVGERGADTESIARELHDRGRPPVAPWVFVECGAADPVRLERMLFGDPGGPVVSDLEAVSPGSSIAAARGGTLFLHDVGELPSAVQSRLARVLRDGEVRIDGEVASTRFRLIAGALPSIDGDVRENRFRADLYKRLAVSRIDLPPLRDRLEDVPALAARLVEDLTSAAGLPRRSFTQAALALLSAINWPGNVAELRAVVERAIAETNDEVIQIEQLLPALQLDRVNTAFVPSGNLRDARLRFERDYIAAVLQHHGWRMADAAQTLGIQRPNLYRKARQLGIPLTRVSE